MSACGVTSNELQLTAQLGGGAKREFAFAQDGPQLSFQMVFPGLLYVQLSTHAVQVDAQQIKALPEFSFSIHVHTKPETHLLNKSGFGLRQLWPGQSESVVIVGLAQKPELGR